MSSPALRQGFSAVTEPVVQESVIPNPRLKLLDQIREVMRVISAMSGTPQLVVKLIYGGGLRLLEALRLRVQDLDFELMRFHHDDLHAC